MKDNPLLKLESYGQSIWLDFIHRGMLTTRRASRGPLRPSPAAPLGEHRVRRLLKGGHDRVVYGLDARAVKALEDEGASATRSAEEFCAKLVKPRVVWLMVPAAVGD